MGVLAVKLVRIARGKETVLEEGSLSKLTNRLKQLRGSTRKGVCGRGGKKYPVHYEIKKSEDDKT
jgi:hypothetical protein